MRSRTAFPDHPAAPRPEPARGTLRAAFLLPLAAVLWAAAAAPAGAANKVMFVTSTYGNGNLSTWADAGGHSGAAAGDAICQARAHAAGIDSGGRTYRAWLSDATDDAFCRVRASAGHGQRTTRCGGLDPVIFNLFVAGPWLRTDGYPFSGDEFDLATARPLTPPRLDEFGNSLDDPFVTVWTGTASDGRAEADTCSGWTGPGNGEQGLADATANDWTATAAQFCGSTARLLCFETGTDGDDLPAWEEPGALAFVTSEGSWADLGSWQGATGTGVDAGDSLCRRAARNAGLPAPDSYVAWLSTAGVDAADRLTIDGPWKLVDGVRIAGSKADLTDGLLFAPISVTELGTALTDWSTVWTGTTESGTATGTDCLGWTSPDFADLGDFGVSSRSTSVWSAYVGSLHCDLVGSLYCFSNVVVVFADGFESGGTGRWSATTP